MRTDEKSEILTLGSGEWPERVVVLLATYNGIKYLEQQLQSIAWQSAPRIDVLVSDDGSKDGTIEMLEEWRDRWEKGAFTVLDGPGCGFVENFRHLIANTDLSARYFAFADQDDVWDNDKLAVAMDALDLFEERLPALYCSRTRIVAETGQELGLSPLFRRKPSFRNAIVQSLAGGNTMMLNRAGFDLIKESCARTSFVGHDWWCYQIISGSGGCVVYDEDVHMDYRQHSGNVIGANVGWFARLVRFAGLVEGRFARWNQKNLSALSACRDLLTDEAACVLDGFSRARDSNALLRLKLLREAGIYRQSSASNLALYIAAMLGKV